MSRLLRPDLNWIRVISAVCAVALFVTAIIGGRYWWSAHHKVARDVGHQKSLDPKDLAKTEAKKVTANDVKPLQVPRSLGVRVLRVPILMYHHVGPLPEKNDGLRRDLTVSAENFSQQVSWLKEHGYTAINLEQLYLALGGGFVLPSKPVVFTFDDGYQDVFDYAVPILQHAGYTGSFAIITGFVGHPDYASWETIKQAQGEGMEIVSHTFDHFDGSSPKYTSEYIKKDLQTAQEDLITHTGNGTKILVYPYGHYTPEYIRIARELGFEMALTVHYGTLVDTDHLMEVPRVRVHGNELLGTFIKNVR